MKEEKKSFIATEFASTAKFGGNTLLDICTKIGNIADYVSLNLGDEETAQKLDRIGIDVQNYVQQLTEGIDAFDSKRARVKWKENNDVE